MPCSTLTTLEITSNRSRYIMELNIEQIAALAVGAGTLLGGIAKLVTALRRNQPAG